MRDPGRGTGRGAVCAAGNHVRALRSVKRSRVTGVWDGNSDTPGSVCLYICPPQCGPGLVQMLQDVGSDCVPSLSSGPGDRAGLASPGAAGGPGKRRAQQLETHGASELWGLSAGTGLQEVGASSLRERLHPCEALGLACPQRPRAGSPGLDVPSAEGRDPGRRGAKTAFVGGEMSIRDGPPVYPPSLHVELRVGSTPGDPPGTWGADRPRTKAVLRFGVTRPQTPANLEGARPPPRGLCCRPVLDPAGCWPPTCRQGEEGRECQVFPRGECQVPWQAGTTSCHRFRSRTRPLPPTQRVSPPPPVRVGVPGWFSLVG